MTTFGILKTEHYFSVLFCEIFFIIKIEEISLCLGECVVFLVLSGPAHPSFHGLYFRLL